MIKVCGVKFKKAGKVYFFDPQDVIYKTGDEVVVETIRGKELGIVVKENFTIKKEDLNAPLKKIIAPATNEEKSQHIKYKLAAKDAFRQAEEKIKEHKLDMKLIDVEYTLDGSKIIFYFSAEGRIDFRDLVKDLAALFKKRIEMHQTGVRDEAKMCGALGPCGLPNCCGQFLTCFSPVSVTMAKDQNLSLNPTKISGACGRLMCCLVYEEEAYKEILKQMPFPDSEVIFEDKIARVLEVNAIKGTVKIEIMDTRAKMEVKPEELKKPTEGKN